MVENRRYKNSFGEEVELGPEDSVRWTPDGYAFWVTAEELAVIDAADDPEAALRAWLTARSPKLLRWIWLPELDRNDGERGPRARLPLMGWPV